MPLIGVSVAVPEPWGAQLQEFRTALGDDAARLIPTHITLLPPYDASHDEVAAIEQHLAEVTGSTPAFGVHLRGTGTFQPTSPVVFVNVVAGISECERLAARLHEGPLSVTTRFPYHPHVTVAHDLAPEALERAFTELAGFECRFDVDQVHLYAFDEAIGWQRCASYELNPRE